MFVRFLISFINRVCMDFPSPHYRTYYFYNVDIISHLNPINRIQISFYPHLLLRIWKDLILTDDFFSFLEFYLSVGIIFE